MSFSVEQMRSVALFSFSSCSSSSAEHGHRRLSLSLSVQGRWIEETRATKEEKRNDIDDCVFVQRHLSHSHSPAGYFSVLESEDRNEKSVTVVAADHHARLDVTRQFHFCLPFSFDCIRCRLRVKNCFSS